MIEIPLLLKRPFQLKDKPRYVFVPHAFALRMEVEFVIPGIWFKYSSTVHQRKYVPGIFRVQLVHLLPIRVRQCAFLSMLFCEVNDILKESGRMHSFERVLLTIGPYRRINFSKCALRTLRFCSDVRSGSSVGAGFRP